MRHLILTTLALAVIGVAAQAQSYRFLDDGSTGRDPRGISMDNAGIFMEPLSAGRMGQE